MRFSLPVVSALVLSSLVGCAASQTEDSGASDEAFSETSSASCAPATYQAALAHYKKAVSGAKDRAAKRICEASDDGDTGTLSNIADESYKAVQGCADFRKIIDTSIYAKPIRDALSANLELPLLTGTLTESSSWPGLAAALPGKTFWGPAADVTGTNASKIAFSAGGKVLVSKQDVEGSMVLWADQQGSWTVDAAGKVTITVGSKATTYELRFDKENGFNRFVLASTDQSTDDYGSLPSECEVL